MSSRDEVSSLRVTHVTCYSSNFYVAGNPVRSTQNHHLCPVQCCIIVPAFLRCSKNWCVHKDKAFLDLGGESFHGLLNLNDRVAVVIIKAENTQNERDTKEINNVFI